MYAICITIPHPIHTSTSWLIHDPLIKNRYTFSYGDTVDKKVLAHFCTRIVARITAKRLKKRIEAYCLGIKDYHVTIINIGGEIDIWNKYT